MARKGFAKLIVGALVALLTLSISLLSPSAANAATICGDSGCGRFYATYVYDSGAVTTVQYVSQYEWMTEASAGNIRGLTRASTYRKLRVGDSTNGFEVTYDYGANQIASTGFSPGQSGWIQDNRLNSCTGGLQGDTWSEDQAWALYFYNSRRALTADTLYEARLTSPAGNRASYKRPGC